MTPYKEHPAGHGALDIDGCWFRWSRYDLVNGAVVPGEGAELEQYDPWFAFRKNVGKYRTVDQPYIALLELQRTLKKAHAAGIRLSRCTLNPQHVVGTVRGPKTEADELVLAWCNAHGLLGLVPVLANHIRLSPEVARHHGYDYVLKRRNHFRDGGAWFTAVTPHSFGASRVDAQAAAEKTRPGVTWFNWMSHAYEERDLKHIEDFFLPGSRRQPFPPCPNTKDFWDAYGEPLHEFAYWCEVFTSSVACMSRWEGGRSSSEVVVQSHQVLSGLAHSAAPSFRFDAVKNRLQEPRVSAGLLASYALMFLWDRMDGRRTIECGNCDQYFVSDEPRALYCSPRCRNTSQIRRYRQGKRSTDELREVN